MDASMSRRMILWFSSLVLTSLLLWYFSVDGNQDAFPRPSTTIPHVQFDGRPLERWDLARKVIEHEDHLVADRLSTYLTLQGLLFAAFGLIMKSSIDKQVNSKGAVVVAVPILLVGFGMAICTVGILSSFTANYSIQVAYDQNHAIEDWCMHHVGILSKEDIDTLEADRFVGFAFPRFRGRYRIRFFVEKLPVHIMLMWNLIMHVLIIWPSEPSKREFLRIVGLAKRGVQARSNDGESAGQLSYEQALSA
jgi:hypothetical protein